MSIVDIPKTVSRRSLWSPWAPRVWPVLRYGVAPRAVLTGSAATGVLATIMLGDRGIGYPIVTVAVIAVALATRRRSPTPWEWAGAVAVVALTSVTVFRTAEWLVSLSMWLAIVAGVVVLSRSWTWTGMVLGALTPILVPRRVVRWVSRSSKTIDVKGARPIRLVAVTAVTLVLCTVFAGLFSAADPNFERILDAVTPTLEPAPLIGHVAVFVLTAVGALAAAYLAHRPPRFDLLADPPRRSVRLWEWAIPLGSLVVMFAVFVSLQIRSLFGGQEHVVATDGLTNAEYARQGFWQLLAVTVLTLIVLAVTIGWASRASLRDRVAVRTLLGALCVLSLVVVASALHRMSLYEQQYGYTTLRLFVTAVELWLGSVFVLILGAGVRMSGRWLPRAVGVGAVLTVLGLAVLNPDAYIAQHNVDRFAESGNIDTSYLIGLSADAVPALDRLPEPERSCALAYVDASPGEWFEYNVSIDRAREVLGDRRTFCTVR